MPCSYSLPQLPFDVVLFYLTWNRCYALLVYGVCQKIGTTSLTFVFPNIFQIKVVALVIIFLWNVPLKCSMFNQNTFSWFVRSLCIIWRRGHACVLVFNKRNNFCLKLFCEKLQIKQLHAGTYIFLGHTVCKRTKNTCLCLPQNFSLQVSMALTMLVIYMNMFKVSVF